MSADALMALARMQEAGTLVLFEDRLPEICLDGDIAALTAPFKSVTDDDILDAIRESEADFTLETDDGKLVHAKYITKEGHELYLVSNRARNVAHVKCTRMKDGIRAKTATLLNPDDGNVAEISLDEPFAIPAARAVFLMFC